MPSPEIAHIFDISRSDLGKIGGLALDLQLGGMFWFTWKKLVGS